LFPQRLLIAAVWTTGLLLTLYGVASPVDHGRIVAGLRNTPAVLEEQPARWPLLLWDPVWLLGSILFLAAQRHRRG
jgi:hypothetical protein